MRRVLMMYLIVAAGCVQAETYRWTDTGGHTVVSDTPPTGKTKGTIRTGEKNAEPASNLPFATRKAAEAFPVVLYTTPDCATECKQARDLLTGRGVPFTEKLLQKPEDFEELKQLIGDPFIPSIKVGKQSFRGFEAGAYNNLLDLASYPKASPYATKPPSGASQ
jgi:glutaredoxin